MWLTHSWADLCRPWWRTNEANPGGSLSRWDGGFLLKSNCSMLGRAASGGVLAPELAVSHSPYALFFKSLLPSFCCYHFFLQKPDVRTQKKHTYFFGIFLQQFFFHSKPDDWVSQLPSVACKGNENTAKLEVQHDATASGVGGIRFQISEDSPLLTVKVKVGLVAAATVRPLGWQHLDGNTRMATLTSCRDMRVAYCVTSCKTSHRAPTVCAVRGDCNRHVQGQRHAMWAFVSCACEGYPRLWIRLPAPKTQNVGRNQRHGFAHWDLLRQNQVRGL